MQHKLNQNLVCWVQNKLILKNLIKAVCLPVHPRCGAKKVKNNAKSVLLAAEAIVNVTLCSCGAQEQLEAEGRDTATLPPLSADGNRVKSRRVVIELNRSFQWVVYFVVQSHRFD